MKERGWEEWREATVSKDAHTAKNERDVRDHALPPSRTAVPFFPTPCSSAHRAPPPFTTYQPSEVAWARPMRAPAVIITFNAGCM